MNIVTFYRDQENEAFGRFLLETIAKAVGVEPDAKRIDRAIYKDTDCGAWVRFDESGVMVGTIVEGSDAEHSERIDLGGIETTEEGEAELERRFWSAVQGCEDFSAEVWAEMESDEEDND